MASGKNQKDSSAGSINEETVTSGTRRDKSRDIHDEIAFQRLAHNIKEGKITSERVHGYLGDKMAIENQEKKPRTRTRHRRKMGRPFKHPETSRLTIRISPLMHDRLREISEARGESINDVVFRVLGGYIRREHGKLKRSKRGDKV